MSGQTNDDWLLELLEEDDLPAMVPQTGIDDEIFDNGQGEVGGGRRFKLISYHGFLDYLRQEDARGYDLTLLVNPKRGQGFTLDADAMFGVKDFIRDLRPDGKSG